MRAQGRYHVTVTPDGEWRVSYEWSQYAPTEKVAHGNALDQRRGEVAARCAIEDDKADRAKQSVAASMVQQFTVKA